MTITLTSEQEASLQAFVRNGEFATIEDAALQLLDERLDERLPHEIGDLAWAKPLVDEALAQVERGEVMTLDAFNARLDARR